MYANEFKNVLQKKMTRSYSLGLVYMVILWILSMDARCFVTHIATITWRYPLLKALRYWTYVLYIRCQKKAMLDRFYYKWIISLFLIQLKYTDIYWVDLLFIMYNIKLIHRVVLLPSRKTSVQGPGEFHYNLVTELSNTGI